MALQHTSVDRPNRPLAIELGVVTTVLIGVYLWQRVMRVVVDPLTAALGPSPVTMPLGGLATAGLFVAGLVAFARAYSAARDVDVGFSFPTRADLGPIALAAWTPVVVVGITKLVGAVTGVPYSTLADTYYTAESPLLPVVALVVLGLLVSVPSLVVICQVLVQGSFGRVLDGDSAVVLTTLVTGFLLTSDAGGLGAVPELGKLVGAAAFVLALSAALYLAERSPRERLRYVVYVPVLLFAVLVVGSAVVEVESVAGGMFGVSQVAVLGIAAFAYDRTDSLLAPALAYLSASLAESVVLVLEAGIHPW